MRNSALSGGTKPVIGKKMPSVMIIPAANNITLNASAKILNRFIPVFFFTTNLSFYNGLYMEKCDGSEQCSSRGNKIVGKEAELSTLDQFE